MHPRLSRGTVEGLQRSLGSAALLSVVFLVLYLFHLAGSGLHRGVELVPPVLAEAVAIADKSESAETEELKSESVALIAPCMLVDVVCTGGEGTNIVSADITKHPLLAEVQEAAAAVCSDQNLGAQCVRDLVAMAWKESRFQAKVIGDQGRSHGWWQIQVKLHGVPRECTYSLECASKWTLDHLGGHGYTTGRRGYAIQRHNGSGEKAVAYMYDVLAISKRLEEIIK